MPEIVTWNSIFALKMNFFAYFVSFLLCYNFWNNHQKFFGYIERIDHKVMWLGAGSMFVLSFIPYLTSLVTSDFNAFFPLFLYGLIFIVIDIFFMKSCYILKNIDYLNWNGDWLYGLSSCNFIFMLWMFNCIMDNELFKYILIQITLHLISDLTHKPF